MWSSPVSAGLRLVWWWQRTLRCPPAPDSWAPGTLWLGLARSCSHVQAQWCWHWWRWWCSSLWSSSWRRGTASLRVWGWWWTPLCLPRLRSGVPGVRFPHQHTYLIRQQMKNNTVKSLFESNVAWKWLICVFDATKHSRCSSLNIWI